MKKFFKYIFYLLFTGVGILGANNTEAPLIPMIPILPAQPTNPERVPLETKTIIMGTYVEVVVPLEILSDIDIEAMVIDDQEIEVPFEIELNREPDKKDYYRINFSENEIDIDNDGKVDTYIYANEFLNSKIVKDNRVVIKGKNISEEGYHKKVVYITIEIND